MMKGNGNFLITQTFAVVVALFFNIAKGSYLLDETMSNRHQCTVHYIPKGHTAGNSGFSSIPRTNLSPFTKDFRGEEPSNESIDHFLKPCLCKVMGKKKKCMSVQTISGVLLEKF